jgi:carboxymethylenebutenolidase
MTIATTKIEVDGAFGTLALPERPSGGVLLLPTIVGVNGFMVDYAKVLAAFGFAALIWDPYHGEPPSTKIDEARTRSRSLTDAGTVAEMRKLVGHLLEGLHVGSAATLGFCLGGRYALLLAAHEPRLKACVAYYPSIETPTPANQEQDVIAEAGRIGCPVQFFYPGQDHVTKPDTAVRLQAALEKRPVPTMIQRFPDANHAFMELGRPHSDTEGNRNARHLSWPMAVAFLRAALT